MNDPNFPRETVIMVSSMAQLAAVYALLGGASLAAVAVASPRGSTAAESGSPVAPQPDAPAAPVEPAAGAADDGTLDAAGWPWSPELHAATKGTTKDGLWRMKVGVSRPDPKPGFPKADGASANGAAGSPTSTAAAAPAASPSTAASAGDDDDEFAAFRKAAEASNSTDAAAAGAVTARKWTDADLGALCNQAAVKLGDPAPVKDLIAAHVPAGQVPHSRNIPEDGREAFAKAVEAKAGIEFAG